MTITSRIKSALFTATSVEVDCPSCGESLPAPCGSLFWTVDELSSAIDSAPLRTCNSCEEPFMLRQQSKAQMPSSAPGGGVLDLDNVPS